MSDRAGFRLLPLGVGDAFSALHYSSCLALESAGQWLLVDCPHPIRKMMREAAGPDLDVGNFCAVALTHLHADHSSGLEGLGFYSRFELGRAMPLAVHASVAERLWTGHLAGSMQFSTSGRGKPVEEAIAGRFFFFDAACGKRSNGGRAVSNSMPPDRAFDSQHGTADRSGRPNARL